MALSKETWIDIEKKFCYGVVKDGMHHMPTMGELSKEYKINKSSISKRAKEYGWDIKKQSFINKNGANLSKKKAEKSNTESNGKSNELKKSNNDILTQDEIDKESAKVVDSIINFDVKCSNIALDIADMVKDNLDRLKTSLNDTSKTISFPEKTILESSKALEVAQKIYKSAIGESLPDNNLTITVKRIVSIQDNPGAVNES